LAPSLPDDTSISTVCEVIELLLNDQVTREEASAWAARRYESAEATGDGRLVDAVDALIAVDLVQTDADMNVTGYLFDLSDVEAAMLRLAGAGSD
jgi:hypothetical protein